MRKKKRFRATKPRKLSSRVHGSSIFRVWWLGKTSFFACFSVFLCEGVLERTLEAIFADLWRFGGPGGLQLGTILSTFSDFFPCIFRGPKKTDFGYDRGGGRRQGLGLSEPKILQNLHQGLTRPAPPAGVRRILWATPPAAGPVAELDVLMN